MLNLPATLLSLTMFSRMPFAIPSLTNTEKRLELMGFYSLLCDLQKKREDVLFAISYIKRAGISEKRIVGGVKMSDHLKTINDMHTHEQVLLTLLEDHMPETDRRLSGSVEPTVPSFELQFALELEDSPIAHAISKLFNVQPAFAKALQALVLVFKSRRKITDLPDEILELIFLEACCDLSTFGPTQLSEVCRRFRDVVTFLPKLWVSVDSNMTTFQLGRHLSLSKRLSLSVSLLPRRRSSSKITNRPDDDSKSTWLHFLKLTTAHIHRWENMYIDTGDQESNIEAFLAFPGRTVKSLGSLTVIYPTDDEGEEFREHLHEKNWKFPGVSSLRTKFNYPPPNCFKSLKECTLGAPHPNDELCIYGIAGFLRSTPNLVRLSITDLGDPEFSGMVHPIKRRKKIRLSKLRFFSLSNTISGGPKRSVSTEIHFLLDLIAMPNIEEVYFKINFGDNEDVFPILTDMAQGPDYNSLKRITYICHGANADQHKLTVCLPTLLSRYPNLESLSLDAPNHGVCEGSCKPTHSSRLRTLHIQHSKYANFYLKKFVSIIKEVGGTVESHGIVSDVSKGTMHDSFFD